jgi:hypothetical protein
MIHNPKGPDKLEHRGRDPKEHPDTLLTRDTEDFEGRRIEWNG